MTCRSVRDVGQGEGYCWASARLGMTCRSVRDVG